MILGYRPCMLFLLKMADTAADVMKMNVEANRSDSVGSRTCYGFSEVQISKNAY